jgi:peptidyl-tRNA hydrolase, PTH1 family
MGKITLYKYIVFGLGNPADEYAGTRHNAGRTAVQVFAKEDAFPAFELQKHVKALVSEKGHIFLVLPETYMNKSGETLRGLKLAAKKHIQEKLIVLHDDLDLALGTVKIVKNRGSAGHKGVESIMRAASTRDFTRIRIGIAKKQDLTKHQSKTTVQGIVIGKLAPAEKTALTKGVHKAVAALAALLQNGRDKAMNEFN